ncbi:MAG: ExbD/TolR family protein, partial [Bryobacteraceae bacterium]
LSPGNNQITADALPGKVKDLLANKLDKECYIKADSRARYQKVEDVVDNLRAAGVDQIGLLTEPVQNTIPSNRPSATTVVQ